MVSEIKNKNILITGGTGSLGKHLVKRLLKEDVQKIIILSRGEHKQVMMERELDDKRLRFLLGDIRDRDRLKRAFQGVDIIAHCAALKHIHKCERDPIEAKKTNVDGAENIIEAAIDCNVEKVLAISTDKAVNPINSYGKAKALADDLFIQANVYGETKFSVIRFGNFVNSRGSVIPLFKQLKADGKQLKITDPEMTRFFISFDEAVRTALKAIDRMEGGEIFYPYMPSVKIKDIADMMDSRRKELIGIRNGEKLHEHLIIPEDADRTYEELDFFVTYPNGKGKGKKVPVNFSYRSDNNVWWLKEEEIEELIA
ncbi:MAG: SDR family NAD(P)-dependent oxidoreductase [Promethearchaeota archaeon]|jgi:UDP-N-acetylglucosamine 4,6-dehydratase